LTKFILHVFLSLAFIQAISSQKFVLLGITQDAGYPQIACQKECCAPVWKDLSLRKYAVSLAIIDSAESKWYLIDATPDMKYQIALFNQITEGKLPYMPEAILLTHAHIGHYTGLIDLGREALNSKNLMVYGSKRMKKFLSKNGPWQQLINLGNIKITTFSETGFALGDDLFIRPLKVPHRDEYTDTYAFEIIGKEKKGLYIPDIDKWNQWQYNITEIINRVDIAFIDATFYSGKELSFRRNIAEIPHPFVIETIALFEKEAISFKEKIHFIHLNHTNPLLRATDEKKEIEKLGYRVGIQGEKY
jgi:pyrroloquinoline quinone biosynthesis protein B